MIYTKYELEFRKNYPRVHRYIAYTRFMQDVQIGDKDDCWEWQGKLDDDGYGRMYWGSKHIQKAAAVAYELFKGSRHGKQVLHKCDNPPCVNPAHLFLGTQQDNIKDMMKKHRHRAVSQPGERNPSALLTEHDVKKIRKYYRKDKYNMNQLAQKYEVGYHTIYAIVNRKTWKRS